MEITNEKLEVRTVYNLDYFIIIFFFGVVRTVYNMDFVGLNLVFFLNSHACHMAIFFSKFREYNDNYLKFTCVSCEYSVNI